MENSQFSSISENNKRREVEKRQKSLRWLDENQNMIKTKQKQDEQHQQDGQRSEGPELRKFGNRGT